jgi:hypothetical protein
VYQIIKDGETMALVDEPVFIRLQENGCYGRTTEEEAQGISVQSTPYNLEGREPLEEGLETVMAVPVDGGVYFSQQQQQFQATLEQMDQIAVELYEMIQEGTSDV